MSMTVSPLNNKNEQEALAKSRILARAFGLRLIDFNNQRQNGCALLTSSPKSPASDC